MRAGTRGSCLCPWSKARAGASAASASRQKRRPLVCGRATSARRLYRPPAGQQDSTIAIPTAGLTTDPGLSGRTEPIVEPAAQQPTRTRSRRTMHRPIADSQREAARLERTADPGRATRRRLSPEQQREVARLYAESTTPTSEIRRRFGIGESSLSRIVQRQGVPL